MFSQFTSPRFEKDKEQSAIGPGSYDLPTTLDEHGHVIPAVARRDLNGTASDTPGPGFYGDATEEKMLTRTPSKKKISLAPSTKENCAATPNRQRRDEAKEEKKPAQKRGVTGAGANPEVEQLKKQLSNEERLRAQAESKLAEMSEAKKWAAEAKVQLQSKERKLEDLQKKVEELSAKDSESQRKVRDLQSEEVGKRKILHEKDATVTSLQKNLDQTKTLNQKLKEQLEKNEADMQPLRDEAKESKQAVKCRRPTFPS
jgi:chromosome segregation ATPase